jgi:RNA polymerase sigma factor (sigma-70 family)
MREPTASPINDHDVFENLYLQGRDRLIESLTGMVRDRDRAEELTERAFQTAWEKRSQFRGDASFGTWLYAIGSNAARAQWRRDRLADHAPIAQLETARHAEPGDHLERLEREERRDQVWKALARVPAKCRRLLVDHYIHEFSIQEIARREGVPVGTIGSRLFAARQLLREAWRTIEPAAPSMQEDKVRTIAEDALKRLVSALQAGRSDALTQYFVALGRFHRYSWKNVMLIQAQRPEATRVAGYHTWQQLGRWVKRGEKGIMIIAPLVSKVEREGKGAPDRPKQPELVRVDGFRTAFVFDVEQTEGRPMPAIARTAGDPKDFGDRLKAVVAERGIALTYDASIAPADGLSSGGQIRLRPGLAPAEEFSVLAHELAHEMLHQGAERGTLPKVVRETQAEAVAFVVSHGIGLETRSAAADYIALYNGDAKTLLESLATVQETSTRILNALLPEERSASMPERTMRPSESIDRAAAAAERETPTLDR